jgi:hypothetical protein
MKNILLLLLSTLVFSCSPKKEDSEDEMEVIDSAITELVPEPDTELYVWRANSENQKLKNPKAGASFPVDSLIKGLNRYYPDIQLEKIRQGADTLYTAIKDSEFLTQRMGSTGAEVYIADVILNLTTVPGINYVSVDFAEGDHAQPGTWSKENFKKYKEIKP